MDFGWSAEQIELHERMRELGTRAGEADPDERMSVLANGGALGLCLPAEHGGEGRPFLDGARAFEGLGETLDDGGLLLAAGAHVFGVAAMVATLGSDAQKRRWLPQLATGQTIATVAATEAESGSDIASVLGVAESAPGGGFRLTAKKRYVTYADRADLFFVVVRNGHQGRGLDALLVPKESGDVTVGELWGTAGLRGARLAPVELCGTHVGADALLGRAGAGLAVFQVAMTFERALVLAFRLGAMKRDLDVAIRFAKKRKLGGVAICKHQAVAHRIARMQQRLETARLLTYRAAWSLDQGRKSQDVAALAKWHVADAAVASAMDHLALLGGEGFLEERGAMATMADTMGGSMHSGTPDVLATIVARWLGL